MEQGTLTIYRASAGSGKTYCLTANYLSHLFTSRNAYKKILAVTFTNKAASEMKAKILAQLYSLAQEEKTSMSDNLQESTGKSFQSLSDAAKDILNNLLHDYSGFYVGTIDSFFQRILKAFTREVGLQQGYTIELDHSLILKNAVENMLEGSGEDKILMKWLVEYIRNRAEEGKNWNLKTDILYLAEEIFKEKFRLLSQDERDKLKNREFLMDYVKELRSVISSFEKRLEGYAAECSGKILKHSVDNSMFLRGDRGGVPSFIRLMAGGSSGAYKPLSATVSQVLDSPPVWSSKGGTAPELQAALKDGLGDIIVEAARFYNSNFRNANTALLILENIYILGILADILENVHIITSSENRFLLSDSGELLWLIIGNDQTPFIYEKAGNAFENFMIDEFQDTSHIQWNNFRPLIMNSMAEGHDNLVVGDVKQSIYRWRNSDWTILGSQLQEEFDSGRLRLENLDTNRRSRKNIIAFNNTLFSILPLKIDDAENTGSGENILGALYDDAYQKYPGEKEGGFVRIEFIEDEEERNFEEISLAGLPYLIEDLNDKGYSGSDIGILVRTNNEGASVLKSILDYQSCIGEEKKKRYNYKMISSESLLLSSSPAVNLIITILSGLHNPEDNLNKALSVRYWMLCQGKDPLESDLCMIDGEPDDLFPEGYRNLLSDVRKMPVFTATESIIKFFELGNSRGQIAYLNTFQDCVLEFSGSNSSDIPSFLEWWESTGMKKSIVLPDNKDSMRVLTIHKTKGLEFRIVIIPFISWPVGHGRKPPVLWLNPYNEPFNRLGIIPVKFKSDLQYTQFEDDYKNERYSACVDNLNLLYVAFTRAIDGLYGFCPRKSNSGYVSSILLDSFQTGTPAGSGKPSLDLNRSFDKDGYILEYGSLPEKKPERATESETRTEQNEYYVNSGSSRFNLRLHGENWLVKGLTDPNNSLNYGRVMHEVFAYVYTPGDIETAVNRLVIEGKIPVSEREQVKKKIDDAVSDPVAGNWFKSGQRVINEAEILLPSGNTRRPDRVIIKDGKAIVVDFKFGDETPGNIQQVIQYRKLLNDMGYKDCEAYLWYIEKNKVITV